MRLPLYAWTKTLGRLNRRVVFKRRKRIGRPCHVESLESRTLMTVDPYFDDGVLEFYGDGDYDTIAVGVDGSGEVLLGQNVILGGIQASEVESIYVYGAGGNDTIDLSGITANFSSLVTIEAYGEAGNDLLIGSAFADYFEGGTDSDTMGGNGGDDTLVGGTGDDLYTFVGMSLGADEIVENPGEGSDWFSFEYFGGKVEVDLGKDSPQTVNSGNLALDLSSDYSIEVVKDSPYDDKIYGNKLNNYFHMLGGTDRLEGRLGDDFYGFTDSNASHDTIIEDAAGGNDVLTFVDYSYAVNVSLESTSKRESATGNLWLTLQSTSGGVADLEAIVGTSQGDTLTGNGLSNHLFGKGGSDNLYGSGGDDSLHGDDGDDYLEGGAGQNYLHGYAGADMIVGGSDGDLIFGGTGNDSLKGGAGNDTVYGDDDNDTIYVGSGGDALLGGYGSDTYVFEAAIGDGNSDTLFETTSSSETDTLDFSSFTGAYKADLTLNMWQTGSQTIVANKAKAALMGESWFEKVIGGAGKNTITGNSRKNIIYGGESDDIISGGGENDTLYGGAGNDILQGQEGTDTLYGDAGNDTFKFVWSSGNSLGEDTIYENSGTDTLDFSSVSPAITVDLESTSKQAVFSQSGTPKLELNLISSTAVENVIGTNSNDKIYGNSAMNSLKGQGGNDELYGRGGQDTLEGGSGNDLLEGGASNDIYRFSGTAALGSDTITEQSQVDYDYLDFQAFGYGVKVDLGVKTTPQTVSPSKLTLTLSSDTGLEVVFGSPNADVITGNSRGVTFVGGAGNDTLYGGSGSDYIEGGDGNDVIYGRAGSDYLLDGDGDDSVYGETGSDFINFVSDPLDSPGNDYLSGGDDADWIGAGGGTDVLEGNAGNDNYVFADWWSGNYRVIENSDEGTDLLDFNYFSVGIELDLGSTKKQALASGIVAVTLANGASIENISGTYEADKLTGNALNNEITGWGGGDTLEGGSGDDTYRYYWSSWLNSAHELLSDSAGIDKLDFSLVGTSVTIDLGKDTKQTVTTHGAAKLELTLATSTTIENVTGTSAKDTITGNSLPNVLIGGGNDDTLSGSGGKDTLEGGTGNDSLTGGEGDDVYVFSGTVGLGTDTIVESASGGGVDTFDFASLDYGSSGGINVDLLSSSSNFKVIDLGGNKSLYLNLVQAAGALENVIGTKYGDTLEGNALQNRLEGGGGDDLLSGVAGDDIYVFSGNSSLGADLIEESPSGGVDTLDFSAFTGTKYEEGITADLSSGYVYDSFFGYINLDLSNADQAIENVIGTKFNDYLTGNQHDNRLVGGAGDDYYLFVGEGDLGTDTVVELSGEGSDWVDFFSIGETTGKGIEFDLSSASANFEIANVPGKGGVSLSLNLSDSPEIENVYATDYDDVLTGNALDNYLDGGAYGNDIFRFVGAGDQGNDAAWTWKGVVTLDFSSLLMPSGVTVDLGLNTQQQVVDDGENQLSVTASNVYHVIGSRYSDRLTSSAASNSLAGGLGDDTYYFTGSNTQGTDTIVEAIDGGSDWIDFSGLNYPATLDLSSQAADFSVFNSSGKYLKLNLSGSPELENIRGSQSGDTLTGNGLVNRLEGGGGIDTIYGRQGADQLVGGNDGDWLYGEGGDDVLQGEAGGDRLEGGGDSDTLIGGEGQDQLYGGDGGDMLQGGVANDVLVGGSGVNWTEGNEGDDVYIYFNTDLAAGTIDDQVVEIENSGSDWLLFNSLPQGVTIDLATTTKQAVHAGLSLTLSSDIVFENIIGTLYSDVLLGNSLDNSLYGNAGSDSLDGRAGKNILDAGAGFDGPEVLDNLDVDAVLWGSWATHDTAGFNGKYVTNTPGDGDRIEWTFADLVPGRYEVWVTWKEDSQNAATNSPFSVYDDSTLLDTVAVNQQIAPSEESVAGFTWNKLDTYKTASGDLKVRLSDIANGVVIGDAVRIVAVNSAPTLATISDKSVQPNNQLSFTASATDPDADSSTLQYSLDPGAPLDADITNGQFTWTPSAVGEYYITVRVTDGGGLSDYETILITVGAGNLVPEVDHVAYNSTNYAPQNANPPDHPLPYVNLPTVPQINELSAVTFTVVASDDGPTGDLHYSLAADAPAGSTIDPDTGEFSWTPSEDQDGAHAIRFRHQS
jgi:Ca2+-binding RTX toxin-like protein